MNSTTLSEQEQRVVNALVLAWPDPMLSRYADDGTLWAEAIARLAVQALSDDRASLPSS